MKIYPVAFEVYDDLNEPMFKVTMEDDVSATVTLSTVVNAELWDEISPLIGDCLALGRDGLK